MDAATFDSEISVVIQGPVIGKPGDAPESRLTYRSIESIRRHLPKAEVILSTWKGSDVTGLYFDQLVESDDPGALCYADYPGVSNNVNRMIVTTRAGLQAATRNIVLRLRSDLVIYGTGFVDFFDRFPARSDWSIFRSKVVVLTIFSRIPGLLYGYPYHPSDWFHFGRRDDLLDLWDVPLAPEPETTYWFKGRPRPRYDPHPTTLCRYTPEQYVWISFLKKYLPVECDYQWDATSQTIVGTERSFASNLIIISPTQATVHLAKYNLGFWRAPTRWTYWGPASCYSHGLWRDLYERYCLATRVSFLTLHRVRKPAVRLLAALLKWQMRARMRVAKLRGRGLK